MTADFTPIRLACSHGPDLHFEGKLVHEYSTQNKGRTKDRWTELRLWETPAGNWVAESVGMSSRNGEGVIREARVIKVGEGSERVGAVMEAFGWTTAAKAFARDMGWQVTVRVE
jgi:hypothetical protein